MNLTRTIAIILLLVGALATIYGGFSYTRDTTAVKLGPLELTVKEKKSVNVPLWVGLGGMMAGGLLLLSRNPQALKRMRVGLAVNHRRRTTTAAACTR